MNDFRAFALAVARGSKAESLLPIVEKELIHYDILCALDKSKWLDHLNFQGGTCLRLCYGAARYSEDLDFSTQRELTETDLLGFREIVSAELKRKFDVDVRVKEPKKIREFEGGGPMKRWQVVVDTAPERPDLPSQKTKIEIAQIPSYTREMRLLIENYPQIQGMYGQTLVGCQSLTEILADKIVSFSQSVKTPRYRDLWDIPWLLGQPSVNIEEASLLVRKKFNDYGSTKDIRESLCDGRTRAWHDTNSEGFAHQMIRFLPFEVWERTAGREAYREGMAWKTDEAFQRVIDGPSNETD